MTIFSHIFNALCPDPAKRESVGAVLERLQREHPELHVRTSVVDLMKALGMDSGLDARRDLSAELGVTGDPGDAATNEALYRALMRRVADNGGEVPEELR